LWLQVILAVTVCLQLLLGVLLYVLLFFCFFFFQAEDGIRDATVTGVQTCALPICFCEPARLRPSPSHHRRIDPLPGAVPQSLAVPRGNCLYALARRTAGPQSLPPHAAASQPLRPKASAARLASATTVPARPFPGPFARG